MKNKNIKKKEMLIDFLLFLNDHGRINNHDFDYEKWARKYIKSKSKHKTQ